uniref:Uncharacterized protein n=1 Tax=Caenorhabditis japonica TaxID=281687 RepID=A0A8R1E5X7_CAEJA
MKQILKDFEDEQLKKLLSGGNPLDEVTNLLKPVLSLFIHVARTEKVWTKSSRKRTTAVLLDKRSNCLQYAAAEKDVVGYQIAAKYPE